MKDPPGKLLRARGRGSLSTGLPFPSPGLGGTSHHLPPFLVSTPYRTSTSLNLTPLNSTQLNSLFDPPRPPFWSLLAPPNRPKIVSSRLLTPYFSKNVIFHEMQFPLGETPFYDPKTAPKTTQDRPKTAPRRSSKPSFFITVFDIDFGSSWVPFWPHLGSLLGSQKLKNATPSARPEELKTTLATQDGPRPPPDRPKTPQEPPKSRPRPPKTSKRPPKTPQRPSRR